MRRTLLVATTNPGKLREIRALLGGAGVELLTLDDLPAMPAPEETGTTFTENARLKAQYYSTKSGQLTVAEDSGLVIDALGGEPGVHSARYLGDAATYQDRFNDILRRLNAQSSAGRTARFVCALAVAEGDTILFETTGTVEGTITERPVGTAGFGYDPIFFFPPYGRTLAEVTGEEKLAVAHRGQAFRALAVWLERTRNGEQTSCSPFPDGPRTR